MIASVHNNIHKIGLNIPPAVLQYAQNFGQITGASCYCIAGGFPRGLYMQQYLNLNPEMNDVDVFLELPTDVYTKKLPQLEEYGFCEPVRTHIGIFNEEENPRGLREFMLSQKLQNEMAGVRSLQFNFGENHPWANAEEYILNANLGINQIAITSEGEVIATFDFLRDMHQKTITMNPQRDWQYSDWDKTLKSMQNFIKNRPEFDAWEQRCTPKPDYFTLGDGIPQKPHTQTPSLSAKLDKER